MALATAADAMVYLDGTKITVVDGPAGSGQYDDRTQQQAAQDLLLGYLSAKIDAATLATWNPGTVPAVIRQIAGRMVAAMVYRLVYSQEKAATSAYAAQLWNEAMALLNDVIVGNIVLSDISPNAIVDTEHINEGNFQPNNTYPSNTRVPVIANPDTTQGEYAFGMGGIF